MTLLCGARLGSGVGRTAYVYAPDPKYVVKVQTNTDDFQNQWEWRLWHRIKHDAPELAKWLAPVVRISDVGNWMIQRRTAPVPLDYLKKNHPQLPEFFTDTKAGNWGLMDGRLVCHDFGRTVVGVSVKMTKAKWWDCDE